MLAVGVGSGHDRAPEHRAAGDTPRVTEPSIRIQLRAHACNMLPAVMADIAEEHGDKTAATRSRWSANAARAAAVFLTRTIALPAVPRVGDELQVDPYTEAMTVLSVTWRADPEDDEPAVAVDVDHLDLDVIADEQDDAVAEFEAAGWNVER